MFSEPSRARATPTVIVAALRACAAPFDINARNVGRRCCAERTMSLRHQWHVAIVINSSDAKQPAAVCHSNRIDR
jgi:hypothetical protein